MEILSKYNHLVTTEHEDLGRWYGTPEVPFMYPGITSILDHTVKNKDLDSYFKKNTEKAIEKRLNETAKIGQELHETFQNVSMGVNREVNREYAQHAKAYETWFLTRKVNPVMCEFVVVSEKYGFAGRVDMLAEINGKLEVVDWKTGNNFGPSWGDQLGAYHIAICEMLNLPQNELGMRLVQVPRDDPKGLKEFKYQHLDFMEDSFLLCLERYKRVPRYNPLKKLGWKYLNNKAMVRA